MRDGEGKLARQSGEGNQVIAKLLMKAERAHFARKYTFTIQHETELMHEVAEFNVNRLEESFTDFATTLRRVKEDKTREVLVDLPTDIQA